MQVLGGANLIALTGPFGSGKSLLLIEFALAMAEHYKKPLIINFTINPQGVYSYCKAKGYKWLLDQMSEYNKMQAFLPEVIDKEATENPNIEKKTESKNESETEKEKADRKAAKKAKHEDATRRAREIVEEYNPIRQIDLFQGRSTIKEDALDILFINTTTGKSRRKCIVCVDELGIFLNARNWQKVSTNFTKYLCQVRRMRVHLIVAFQFLEQVDKQFRLLVQHWIVCQGLTTYSKQLQGPRLHIRLIYHYTPAKFNKLESSKNVKAAFVRPWLWAKQVQYHILPLAELIAEIKNTVTAQKYLLEKRKNPQARFIKKTSSEKLLFNCFDSFEVIDGDEEIEPPVDRLSPDTRQEPNNTTMDQTKTSEPPQSKITIIDVPIMDLGSLYEKEHFPLDKQDSEGEEKDRAKTIAHLEVDQAR